MINKKLLIICYYWPPNAGIATHRWLHMSNYLAELNYEVNVMVPDQANYNNVDKELIKLVSPKVKVIKTKFREIRNLLARRKAYKDSSKLDDIFFKDKNSLSLKERIMLWVRGNVFIPDARISWYFQSRKSVNQLIRDNNIDVLITSGTPHSVHLFGLYAKKKINVKWIADFRDPWTGIEYHNHMMLNKRSEKKHKNLEKQVLSTADVVTTVSEQWANDFTQIGAKKTFVVLNGFEEKTFRGINFNPDDDFVICHTGTMRADRNPIILWDLLERFNSENKLIKVHLYGNVAPEIVADVERRNLQDQVKIFKSVPHRKILEIMQRATILLVLVNQDKGNSLGRIPAKIFEYIRSQRPLLLIGNPKGDAAKIVNDEKLGIVVNSEDLNTLYDEINLKYKDFTSGNLIKPDVDYSKFSRESMALRYSELIESI